MLVTASIPVSVLHWPGEKCFCSLFWLFLHLADSRDEACQFEDLMRASEAARVEAASLEASLEPDLDSLLQELSLF